MVDNPNGLNTTPEEAMHMRLEGIFMPHIKARRDGTFGEQPKSDCEPRFVHYSSAAAVLNIIKTKQVWMRNTTCMSDYREVQHGFDIYNKFFTEKDTKDMFAKALEPCVPGAAQEAIDLFNKWWMEIRLNTFITSISQHDKKEDLHGRLSMWRAFGGNTARVAIVLKIPWTSKGAEALNISFNPVTYLAENEMHQAIVEAIKNVGKNSEFLRSVERKVVVNWCFHMLLTGVTCTKHEGFREEQEWRAIYLPRLNNSPLMQPTTEVIGGIPQIIYRMPIDERVAPVLADLEFSRIFDRLIIGPSPYPWAMYEAFVEALTQAGIADAGKRVFTSNIPIRT
jgi:hypothetical protein